MKIHGTNRSHINPYYEQQQKVRQSEKKQTKDQLEISDAAKKLQQNDQIVNTRQSYVQEIKQQIELGEYKIQYDQTSKKLIDFFTDK